MKTGQQVRLVQPVIQGEVKARRINEGTDEIEVLVEFKESGGTVVTRWFDEAQVEEVKA